MSIKCLADDYGVKENKRMHYVYNKMYEEPLKSLIIASVFGLLIPDAADYYIPICIEIEKYEGNIIIGKKLEVIGNAEYRYFIAKHQYDKWKKTYKIIKSIIIAVGFLIDGLFLYLFWKMHCQRILEICVIGMFFLTIGAVVKLESNNRKRKKYAVVDITF